MPPGPMMSPRLAANSANTIMSMASTKVYSLLTNAGKTIITNTARAAAINAVGDGNCTSVWATLAEREWVIGLPNKPFGLNINTSAITMNSATSVNLLNSKSTPNSVTAPRPMQYALTKEMMIAATNAPGKLPSPPTTTTTNTSAMIVKSIARFAGSRGSCKAPPMPAKKLPSANTAVNKSFWFTPNASVISRSCVAARSNNPKRVFLSNVVSANSINTPSAINSKS